MVFSTYLLIEGEVLQASGGPRPYPTYHSPFGSHFLRPLPVRSARAASHLYNLERCVTENGCEYKTTYTLCIPTPIE